MIASEYLQIPRTGQYFTTNDTTATNTTTHQQITTTNDTKATKTTIQQQFTTTNYSTATKTTTQQQFTTTNDTTASKTTTQSVVSTLYRFQAPGVLGTFTCCLRVSRGVSVT